MRIIAGSLRGRQIAAPPGMTTRPMLDRVRQAVFDIIGAAYDVPGTIPPVAVLDIFAGSGALGIEALSRGAAFCCFVEEDFTASKTLLGNLRSLGLVDQAKVLRESATEVRLTRRQGEGEKRSNDNGGNPQITQIGDDKNAESLAYTIVFLDPPYPLSRDSSVGSVIGQLLVNLPERVSLAPGAMIVLRHEAGLRYDEQQYGKLKAFDVRRYGGMDVTFMEVVSV